MIAWCAVGAHAGPAAEPWWDPAWKRRARVAIDDRGQVAPMIAPLTVREGDLGFTHVGRSGEVRFVLDGATVRFDVEAWDGPWGSAFWLELPAMDTATADLWMYWANPAAVRDPASDVAWGANMVAVWHLSDCGATCADALGGPPLDANDTVADGGLAGGGLAADGTGAASDYVDAPFTASMWVRPEVDGSGETEVFLGSDTFEVGRCGDDGLWFDLSGYRDCVEHGLAVDVWHLVVVSFEPFTTVLTVDDTPVNAAYAGHAGARLAFGADEQGENAFNGVFDEIRLSRLSPDPTPARDWQARDLLRLGAMEASGTVTSTVTGGSGGDGETDGVGGVGDGDPQRPVGSVRLIGGRCDCDGVGGVGGGGVGWAAAGLGLAIATRRRGGA